MDVLKFSQCDYAKSGFALNRKMNADIFISMPR